MTVLIVSPAAAQSSTELRLERAHVSVWPEYDDPRLLILYEGAFVDDDQPCDANCEFVAFSNHRYSAVCHCSGYSWPIGHAMTG